MQYFTVYAFSTENWKRPQDEVDALMNLFRSYLKEAAETMFERGVAVRVLGDLTVLPEDIRAQIRGGGRDRRSAWSGRGDSLAVYQLRRP